MDLMRSVLRMKAPGERKPDFQRFARTITTNQPGPVSIGDLYADVDTVGNFLGEKVLDWASLIGRSDHKPTMSDLKDGYKLIGQIIRFCCLTGWDYAFSFSLIPFPGFTMQLTDNTSAEVEGGKRGWMDDNRGPIMSWDDFESYRWPQNFRNINIMSRIMAKRVPEGMKVMVIPGGMFEWTTWLMGLVPFSYALVDQPDLVDAVIQKVSDTIYAVVEDIMEEPHIGGIFMGDDLGHFSGTFVSPKVLRQKFFPHTKRIVDLVHSAGKIFALHSCGNIQDVMDDLIDMGIDAKHSFEDKIMLVEEAYTRYGDRIGIIGGIDVNIMAGGSEQDVRGRARQVLDSCGSRGRYVLGTGNSIANYIPLRNYLAMVDEARKWNRENYGREW